MKKTIIISALVALISSSLTAFAVIDLKIFSDVKSDSYYEVPIFNMYQLGVIEGVDEDTFAPKDPISRGQVATMLDRYNEKKIKALEEDIQNITTMVCSGFDQDTSEYNDYQEAIQSLCLTQMP
jgi:hypothetical protein